MPAWVAGLAVAVALVMALWDPAWRVARLAVTACHEGGHALVAALTGRQLQGVRLERDSSGVTISRGRHAGPGAVATLAAGYLAPGVAGLLAAWAVAERRPGLVLVGVLAGAVLLVLWVRNLFGLLVLAVLGAGAWGVLDRAPQAGAGIALGVAVFLLVAAVREVVDLARHGRTANDDPAQLARMTHLPRWLWTGVFLLANLGLAGAGAWLLLR